MGLQERRQIERLKTESVPEYEKRLKEYFGKEIPYETDWESFDLEATYSANNFFNFIANALEAVGRDDLGKEAIRESIHRIVVRNITDPKAKKLSLSEGTLLLEAALGSDDWDGRISDSEIITYLENTL
ncbi:MAG: hypothetical protein OHK0029_08450 [Armatimonadaceae bacterium]